MLVSFFALMVFWVKPKLRGGAAGWTLPAALGRFADARVSRVVLRTVGVLLLGVLLAAAWFGTGSESADPAATWFYVWFWVGLVPVSLLLGPTIALVQVGAIVLGHIVGVTSAHDRAIGIVRRQYVRVGQYPMLAVMVAVTATGIALVSGG